MYIKIKKVSQNLWVGIKLKAKPFKFKATFFWSFWSTKDPAHVDKMCRVLQGMQPLNLNTVVWIVCIFPDQLVILSVPITSL